MTRGTDKVSQFGTEKSTSVSIKMTVKMGKVS